MMRDAAAREKARKSREAALKAAAENQSVCAERVVKLNCTACLNCFSQRMDF